MDYEKKYKEALERAKENKDIEIKKDIIRSLKIYIKCIKDGYDASSAKDFVVKEIEKQIAWLEKQGDKDSQVKLPTFTFDDILALQCCMETAKKVQNDKDLYEKLNDLHGRIYDAYYLEKQGEQNPYSGVSFKYNSHTWGMCARDDGVEILMDSELKAFISLDKSFVYPVTPIPSFKAYDITYNPVDKFEPKSHEGEQKSDSFCRENCKGFQETGKCFADGECKAKREAETIDKFKPEFKVGDWVVFDNGNVEHITSVGTHGYTFDDGDYLLHDECDKIAHLWSIQDAKDGDVLVSRSPFIYGKQCPYGGLNWCNNKFIKASNFIFTDSPVHPATKEQRDLLFQKMKEAGYIFDFEKKELKKLSQSEVTKTSDQEEIAEIPFGAKDSELQEATYFIPKGFHAEIKGDIVLIKKGKQKFEWSEEDEHRLKDTIYFLDTAKKHYASTVELDACIDWLKSLKPHKQWKPSDEQMLALEAKITIPPQSPAMTSALIELYQQLKKL